MRRRPAALAAAVLLASPAAVAAAVVDENAFRYVRTLTAPAGRAVSFAPDGPLFAHARLGLADLRILDADGRQVPWRVLPPRARGTEILPVALLNRGTRGGRAVALVDLGPRPPVHDRLELVIPDRGFVGRVVVRGSRDRRAFTRLSTTVVYDVAGAERARSTTVVYPPTDFRYLALAATGVSEIAGARASAPASRPPLEERVVEALEVAQDGDETVVVADLGFARIPVDEVRVVSTTPLYDRPVGLAGSNDRSAWTPLATGRVFRLADSLQTSLGVAAHHRYLRATIANGDDEPLVDLRLVALARPRDVLLQPGFRPPYRVLYGNPQARAPEYDFASLPLGALGLESVVAGHLGSEAPNEGFRPPADTRSFFARHPAAVRGALAAAAAVLVAGGLLALRRRA